MRLVTPTPPINLTQPCPEVDVPEIATLGQLLDFTITLVNQYGDCRAKQKALATWQN